MANQPIRVGLIGATMNRGWGWRSHVPALQALPQFELVAVCTAHRETAEESAKAVGARACWDYRELLNSSDIEAVTIATRVPWHREMALAALAAGKHVYCEWPLGSSLAEVEEMAAAARSASVRSMAGLQGRLAPWALRLKELVDEGYVGRMLTVHLKQFIPNGYMNLPFAAKRSGGNHILSIQAAHMLDSVCSCLGEFTHVSAQVGTRVPQWHIKSTGETVDVDAPDYVLLNAVLPNGAVVSAHFANTPLGGGSSLEVYGEEGYITMQPPRGGAALLGPLTGQRQGEGEPHDLPIPDRLITVPKKVPSGSPQNLALMYVRFAEAIRTGTTAEPNFDTALRRFRLLAAIEQSANEGGRAVTPQL